MTPAERRDHPQRLPGPLLAEVAVLDDVGPPRRHRFRPYSWTGVWWLTPTVLVLGLAIVWPVARTVYRALFDKWSSVNQFSAAFDDDLAGRAVLLTVVWATLVPATVVVLGYLLAAASRGARLGRVGTAVLVAPTALSMVVTGIAFRLLYDPAPERGTATFLSTLFGDGRPPWLGSTWIGFALMSAFVWAWVGIAVIVFRAVLDGIPQQVLDAARAEGATGWDLLWTVKLPMLRRVAALLLALIAVATSRSFDLVLLMAPGSVRDDAIVLPVYVWQHLDELPTAALNLVWLLILGVVVAVAGFGARQQWPLPIRLPESGKLGWWPRRQEVPAATPVRNGADTSGSTRRRLSRITVAGAIAVWAVPLILLLTTAFQSPTTAATTSWPVMPSLESFDVLFTWTPMLSALANSVVLAGVVTVVVLVLATLASYTLAWLRPPGRSGLAVPLLAAAVVPAQIIAPGVADALKLFGMANTSAVLVLIHIAIGLPFAILLLRPAFATVPVELLQQARLGARSQGGVLRAAALGPAKPVLIGVAALEFVRVWNDLVAALLAAVPELAPVGPTLFTQARLFATSAGVLAAGAVVTSLVPLLIMALTWRHIVTALVSGVVRR